MPRAESTLRFRSIIRTCGFAACRFSRITRRISWRSVTRRHRVLGPHLPLFYDRPLHLVRGEGVWVYDADGSRYLDAYNNVPHVGHCHPRVVAALSRQAATLNIHTRARVEIAQQPLRIGDDVLVQITPRACRLAGRYARSRAGRAMTVRASFTSEGKYERRYARFLDDHRRPAVRGCRVEFGQEGLEAYTNIKVINAAT
jgi:glutamate-1-semialdehyde aminotransferase